MRSTSLAFSGNKSFEMPGDLDEGCRVVTGGQHINCWKRKHIPIPSLEHGNGRGKHADRESDYPAPRCSSFPATSRTALVLPLLPFPQEQLGALRREEAGPCLCFTTWLPSQVEPGQEKDLKAKSRQAVRAAWGQCFSIVSGMLREKQTVGSDLTDGNQTAPVKSETSPGFTPA